MKRTILVKKEINLRYAECEIDPGWWEDAEVNGETDDNDNPRIPCVEDVEYEINKWAKMWCPIIDLDTGKIINWEQGKTARTYYKVRDGVTINFIDENEEIVKTYEGYVPRFLAPDNSGWFRGEDYLEMTIDENGYIKKFDNNLDDIFEA